MASWHLKAVAKQEVVNGEWFVRGGKVPSQVETVHANKTALLDTIALYLLKEFFDALGVRTNNYVSY